MAIALVWILTTLLVTLVGRSRDLGGLSAFLISLILSPVVGIIACAFSPSLKQLEYQDTMLRLQRKQVDYLEDIVKRLDNSEPEEPVNSERTTEFESTTFTPYVEKPTVWQRIKYGI